MKNKIIDIIDNNDIGSSDLLKYKRVWNTMEHGKKKRRILNISPVMIQFFGYRSN